MFRTSFAERHVSSWLKVHMAAKNSQGRRWCPDISYGPHRTTPGSVLPSGVPIFDDVRTIKIEIGVTQPWGMAQGQLDHKAISRWAVMPGVEYVLCVKFDDDFANAEYKLYDARVNPLVKLAPLPIVAPRTEIHLDGRTSNPRYSARDGAPDSFPENSVGGFVLSIGMGNASIRYQRFFYEVTTRFLHQHPR